MTQRVRRLQEEMRAQNIQAYYVTNPYNLRYISGFTGTSAVALVLQEQRYLITDFRYRKQAEEQCQDFEVVIAGGSASGTTPLSFIAEILANNKIDTLSYEPTNLTVSHYHQLQQKIPSKLKPAEDLIEQLREIKDSEEKALIKRACEITEKAFDSVLSFIKPGMTEIEIANFLDFAMREGGASGVSFDTIVASGKRSAMPHGVASDKRIETGDLITIDFGCYYKGYCSDMTRTVALGEPVDALKEIYQVVFEANRRVSEHAKPGITGEELDAVARDYITACGYGEAFGHALGHSLGLEVHEFPYASPSSDHAFVIDNFITNEPGIYIEGLGGVRIEDDLLITADGNECYTNAPRELIIL